MLTSLRFVRVAAAAAVCAALAAPRVAAAADWFVAPIGAVGVALDCAEAARTGAPLASLQLAVDCVERNGANNDRIRLRDGEHLGAIVPMASHSGVVIEAVNRHQAVVRSPSVMATFPNAPLLYLGNVSGWRVRGLSFRPADPLPSPTTVVRLDVIVAHSTEVVIEGNQFRGGLGVVFEDAVQRGQIVDNEFEGAWAAAIGVGGEGDGGMAAPCPEALVARNKIRGVLPAALTPRRPNVVGGIVLGRVSNASVVNNAVLGVPGPGIFADGPDGTGGPTPSVARIVHNTVLTVASPMSGSALGGSPAFVTLGARIQELRNNIFFVPAGHCTYAVNASALAEIRASGTNAFAADALEGTCFALNVGAMSPVPYATYVVGGRETGSIRAPRAGTFDPVTALLVAGSAAINRGVALDEPVVDDVTGSMPPRRVDGMPDIGCHEFAANVRPDGGVTDASVPDGGGQQGDSGVTPGEDSGVTPGEDSGVNPNDPDAAPTPPGLRFRGGGCACSSAPARGVTSGAARGAWLLVAAALGATTARAARRHRARSERDRAQ